MDHFYRRAGLFAGIFALAAASSCAASLAQDAAGLWTRDDGMSRIEVKPCGAALCGYVVWLKNPRSKARVGEKVFFDMMRSDQNSWEGSAFNPEDGRTYSGRMVLSGKKLKTAGCVLGGLICKTVYWRRGG